MEFYVYVWRDSAGVPFYVGKGKGDRAYDASATRRSREFLSVHSIGGCSVEIVDYFIHEAQAHAFEIELIAKYGRRDAGGLLVNKTDGGEGGSGAVRSQETRAKMSDAHRGKPKSLEHRANLSGRPHSPERRAKISAARLGHKHTDETRAKMSVSHIGKRHSDDALAKMSAAQKIRTRTPEQTAKMTAGTRMAAPKAGYKGVYLYKDQGFWGARIFSNGKRVYLGGFLTEKEAALAYDRAAYEAWGDACYLNFPDKMGGTLVA